MPSESSLWPLIHFSNLNQGILAYSLFPGEYEPRRRHTESHTHLFRWLHVRVLQNQQASSDLCSAAPRHSECVARPDLVFLPGNLPGFRPLPWARPPEVLIALSSPGCKGHAAQHQQLGNLASVPRVPQLLLGDYLHQRLSGQVASQIEECPAIFIRRPCLGPLTLLGTHWTSSTAGSCRKTQTGPLH